MVAWRRIALSSALCRQLGLGHAGRKEGRPDEEVTALLAVFALPRPCAACSCVLSSPAEKFARADVVFRGRVTAATPDASLSSSEIQRDVIFRVETVWKGPTVREIVASPDRSWVQCGNRFVLGDVYLVYANGSNADTLAIGSCQGTRSMRYADEDLRADLGALGPGTPVASSLPERLPNVGEGGRRLLPLLAAGAVIVALAGAVFTMRRGGGWREP